MASEVNSTEEFSLWKIAVPAFGPSLMFGIGEGAILPIIPLMAKDLGGSVSMAALIIALVSIGALINNIPASLITMKWGERWAIVGAGIWSALGMVLCILTSNIYLFAVGCFMVGMSQSVYNLARQSFLTEMVPLAYRARALSTLGGMTRVGMFIGPFIAAAFIHFFGIVSAFGVGIVGMICAVLIGSRIPDKQFAVHVEGQPAPAAVTMLSTVRDHKRVFLTLGLTVLLVMAVRSSRQAVIPLWADHIGLAPAVASLIYGLSGGVDMLLFYPAGKVMDIKGRRWVAVPSMVIMGVALIVMPFTTGYISLLIVAMCIGFGNGIGAGMNMTLGADHAPRHGRTHFLGVWRFMADIGGSSGPALLSLLVATVSLSVGVAVTGGIALIAAALLARWIPRRVG